MKSPLLRAIRHARAGDWPEAQMADRVILAFEDRHRRRIRLRTAAGLEVLLDLARAVAMAAGDGLEMTDGRWIAIQAAAEPVADILAPPKLLLRLAWHLGNRHMPTEIQPDRLRIRPDHVVEAMLEGLGGKVERREAPFQPEGGAYDPAGAHSHSHSP